MTRSAAEGGVDGAEARFQRSGGRARCHNLTAMLSRSPHTRLALGATVAVAAAAAALALALSMSGSGGDGATRRAGVSAGAEPAFAGATLPGDVMAPAFTLRTEGGRRVSLAGYRGRVVVLAFLYSTCGGPCVLIAQQIRGALDELQAAHARSPAVLIVSADPAADTPARVRRFLAEVSLSGRASYLTGTRAQLRAVWAAYHVHPASDGIRRFAEYATVLLIDLTGAERVLYQSEQLTPEALSHDVTTLYTSA